MLTSCNPDSATFSASFLSETKLRICSAVKLTSQKSVFKAPGITSAAKAKKDGYWNLSQSNLQNLEKIEELFLHTIEQEKKIEALKAENTNLTEELETLKADMELIKAMLLKNQEND